MEHESNTSEAERLLSIASKLLLSNDLTGAREFSLLAQETDPLLDGSDQILAVADVLLAAAAAADKPDHYSVLGLDPIAGPTDLDAVRRSYRRLALLLHPDKNRSALAESAFRHVSEAWALLSDPSKKSAYDRANGLGPTGALYAKVDLREAQQKLPVRRPVEEEIVDSFWTACPYCYSLYEYLRVYEDCCLRCQNCRRAFHGVTIPSLPPFVPGREAYYCNYNLFPLKSAVSMGKPENTPRVVTHNGGVSGTGFVNGAASQMQSYATSSSTGKKRGRPRKYPLL